MSPGHLILSTERPVGERMFPRLPAWIAGG